MYILPLEIGVMTTKKLELPLAGKELGERANHSLDQISQEWHYQLGQELNTIS